MSPSIYAALINSLFQNPAPMFAGSVMVAFAAAMTALKTGKTCSGRALRFSSCVGTAPRLRHAPLQAAQIRSDRR